MFVHDLLTSILLRGWFQSVVPKHEDGKVVVKMEAKSQESQEGPTEVEVKDQRDFSLDTKAVEDILTPAFTPRKR